MNRLARWARKFGVARAVCLVLLFALVPLRIWDPRVLTEIRLRTFDLYQVLRPREQKLRPVTIVDIDEASLREIGQWPWPRTIVADLVTKLTALGAVAIGFDIIFAEPDRMSPANAAAIVPQSRRSDSRKAAKPAEQRRGPGGGDPPFARGGRAVGRNLPCRKIASRPAANRRRHQRARSQPISGPVSRASDQRAGDRKSGGRARRHHGRERTRRHHPPRAGHSGGRGQDRAVADAGNAARRDPLRRNPGPRRPGRRAERRLSPLPLADRRQGPAVDPFQSIRSDTLRLRQGRPGRHGAGRQDQAEAGAHRHVRHRLARRQDDAARRRAAGRRGPRANPRKRIRELAAVRAELGSRRRARGRSRRRARDHRGGARAVGRHRDRARRHPDRGHDRGVVLFLHCAQPADRLHLSADVELAALPRSHLRELFPRAEAAPADPLRLRLLSLAATGRAACALAGKAGARRRGAPHDHPVQRRARLHHHFRVLQGRPAGPHAADEPLSHAAHQRHHRAQGHDRQIYRRRHHGVLERAGRRRRAGGERLRRGARNAEPRRGAQCRAQARGRGERRQIHAVAHRHRAQHRAVRGRQHGVGLPLQLFGAGRHRQRRLAARGADQGLSHADGDRLAHRGKGARTSSPRWRST